MNKPLRKVRDQGIITTLGREATIIGKYTEDVDHQVVSLNSEIEVFEWADDFTLSIAVLFARVRSFHIPSFGNWFMFVEIYKLAIRKRALMVKLATPT